MSLGTDGKCRNEDMMSICAFSYMNESYLYHRPNSFMVMTGTKAKQQQQQQQKRIEFSSDTQTHLWPSIFVDLPILNVLPSLSMHSSLKWIEDHLMLLTLVLYQTWSTPKKKFNHSWQLIYVYFNWQISFKDRNGWENKKENESESKREIFFDGRQWNNLGMTVDDDKMLSHI